jgi:hypothetical protein
MLSVQSWRRSRRQARHWNWVKSVSPAIIKRIGCAGISASLLAGIISGCVGSTPLIGIAGAEFPVWILCLIAGILAALFLRPVFVAIGIDDWMAPRPVVYASLALTMAFLFWLLTWR